MATPKQAEPHKPRKRQIVIQVLYQQSLRPDREHNLEQQSPNELLWRIGRSAFIRVQGDKCRLQLLKCCIDTPTYLPDRMMLGRTIGTVMG